MDCPGIGHLSAGVSAGQGHGGRQGILPRRHRVAEKRMGCHHYLRKHLSYGAVGHRLVQASPGPLLSGSGRCLCRVRIRPEGMDQSPGHRQRRSLSVHLPGAGSILPALRRPGGPAPAISFLLSDGSGHSAPAPHGRRKAGPAPGAGDSGRTDGAEHRPVHSP